LPVDTEVRILVAVVVVVEKGRRKRSGKGGIKMIGAEFV